MKRKKICCFVFSILFVLLLLDSKVSADNKDFGKGEYRNIVILGENVSEGTAKEFANQYQALVLHKKGRGFLANGFSNLFRSTFGPSRAMLDLMEKLKSISNTDGEWKFMIPAKVERYFLVTLRNMEDDSVKNAHGQIVLLESKENVEIKKEVLRVLGSSFDVVGLNK